MTPVEQLKVCLRALRRIGEHHTREGVIARLAVLEATGKHPWGFPSETAERSEVFNAGMDMKVTAESRLDKLANDMHQHRISIREGKPYKTENVAKNIGRSAETILGSLVAECLGWNDMDKVREKKKS